MTGAYSWARAEAPHGEERYDLTRGGTPIGRLTIRGTITQPSLVLGALCDALAGGQGSAVKPDTPLGQPAPDEPLTAKQRTAIHLGLAEYKPEYRERPARLAALTQIVGRPITSTNDLSKAEASMVLDRIEAARARARRGVAS